MNWSGPVERIEQIKAYLSQPEKKEVTALAKQARITMSELIRRLVLGKSLPDTGREKEVLALSKVNGDLARLGNLLKLALDQSSLDQKKIDKLCNEIKATHREFKEKMRELH